MYDSTKEDAFIVHLLHKVKFTWENRIYVYMPPYVKQLTIKDDKVKFDSKVQFLETVDENKKFYTNMSI
jgi:hypothetical protein